jgi:hypothetical protein
MVSDTQSVELIKGIEAIDLALYIAKQQILILADLHIGIEDAMVKQGILVPKFHFKDLVQRVESIFTILEKSGKQVKLVVINGDLKHEFGTISDEEWRNTLKMLDYLLRKAKVVLVKGNHDRILGPIAEKRNILVVDHFIADDVMVTHGDSIPDIPKSIKTIIIGHEHPAVSLDEGIRKETYKCWLLGKHNRNNLIVQPSANPVSEGTDVKKEQLLSPFLKKDIGNFNAYIVADKIYDFGKLKKI